MPVKNFQGMVMLAGVFVTAAVMLGFFASIGIWAGGFVFKAVWN